MSIEDRLAVLEEKVELLTRQLESPRKDDWTKRVIGSFANFPEFDEVLRLGREFRKQQNRIPGPEDVAALQVLDYDERASKVFSFTGKGS